MAIITISRELAALGDETARALAEQLKYRFVDKSALEERIKSYGVTNQLFQKYDEKNPSFWESLSQDRDEYLHFLKSAVLAEAGEGGAVIIGRGAAVILKGVPGVFSIFLVSPLEVRLERVKSYFRCDDKRARQIIERSDRDREGFHSFFFETRWANAANYHLTLNTGHLYPELCAETIKYVRKKTSTKETEAQCTRRIAELKLGQQIKHRILYEKKTPVHFLEASVSDSRVTLYGEANAQSLAEAAITSARELAPDSTIQSEIQIVQEYSIMPLR